MQNIKAQKRRLNFNNKGRALYLMCVYCTLNAHEMQIQFCIAIMEGNTDGKF